MGKVFRRRSLLQAGVVAGAGFGWPASRACEFFAAHLRITHPWTRASVEGATSAVVCMKFDEVSMADRLIGVETPVAEAAEIGGLLSRPSVDFDIPAGLETHLSESGTYLRLLRLRQPLEVARAYPLLLIFERGAEVKTVLTVDYAQFRFL